MTLPVGHRLRFFFFFFSERILRKLLENAGGQPNDLSFYGDDESVVAAIRSQGWTN